MRAYWFSLTRIFPYKDRIVDSVLIWEYTVQWKPVCWHILRSVLNDNLYIFHCFVVLFKKKKDMKNHKYHFCLLFVIHFHFLDISLDFSRWLNFVEKDFKNISRGLNFTNRKICDIHVDFISRSKPKPTRSAKYNPCEN